jgi:hypothetical protein
MATDTPYPSAIPARRSRTGGGLAAAVQDLEGDRVLGIVGAAVVVVATGLSWYTQRSSLTIGGLVQHSSTGNSLWHVHTFAAWLLVAGAAVGVIALLLAASREWRGGMVTATAGLGIIVYGLVAMVDLPDLGSVAIVGPVAAVSVATSVDVGPFVAVLGGFLLTIGGLAASGDAAPMAARG